MDNFDPFAQRKKGAKTHKIMMIIVGVLVVFILLLIGVLVFSFFKGKDKKTSFQGSRSIAFSRLESSWFMPN
jgi:flagellar basal body-associated protein FliL